MKSLIFILICCFAFTTQSGFAFATESTTYWAKIEKEHTLFYAQATENSALFELPSSYFVLLTGEDGEFYTAEYKNVKGYVKKMGVTPMDGTPQMPFFNENFRAFIPSGIGLYATSEMKEDYKILTIPYLYEELEFYGSIKGETSIPDKSDIWHYCKYDDETFGYVYSSFCDKLSSPPLNSENFSIIDELSFKPKQQAKPLSSTAMTFIIIGVSLPCLIVLYLLMKPNLMMHKPQPQKEKYKVRRKRDYFEFDQSDLN